MMTTFGSTMRRYPAVGRTGLHVFVIAVTFCNGVSAVAQTHSATVNFRSIDTDGDAKLDRGELAAAADRDFGRLDGDHDGYLTRGELRLTRGKRLLLPFPGRFRSQAAFMAADTDRDRKIDKHEYEHAVVAAYIRCDRNRDDTIEMSDLRHCGL